ncbi:MAG: hypothetical protein WCT77_06485, partial [Bacteroidota bacterium]
MCSLQFPQILPQTKNSFYKKTMIFPILLLLAVLFINFTATSAESQGTWVKRVNFGGGERTAAAAFAIGSKGYIGTGHTGFTYSKDFWEYNPANNSWTQKTDFGGVARVGATGFSIGSKGYIGIGNDDVSYKNDFWEYDPSTNSWTQKTNFGGTARAYATGFTIGSKGYIGTGHTGSVPTKDFWEYDTSANSWAQKADFGGTARAYATGFSIGTKGYIGTGSDLGGYDNDFWEYNPSSNSWTQKADFGGSARFSATGFSLGNKGYIGTGNDGVDKKDFWEYNPSSNTWTQISDLPDSCRENASAFSVGEVAYVGTGTDWVNFFADIHAFVSKTIETSPLSSDTLMLGIGITVSYTTSGTFSSSNTFTVQLSDSSGNFTSPTVIGTLEDSASSGDISCTIPYNVTVGTTYRIRVVSNDPNIPFTVPGSDNGSNVTILSPWTQKANFGGTA